MTRASRPPQQADTAPDSAPAPATTRRGAPPQLRLVVGLVVVCALAALFWPRGKGDENAPGGFLVDDGGRPVPLASRLTSVTLVHFWATWCPPCVEEVPAIQGLARDLASHPDFSLVMVAVSDRPEKVRTFLGDRYAGVLFDPNWKVAHRYGTQQLPETYLLVDGEVTKKFVGATDWSAAEARRPIEAALARRERSGR